MECKSDVFLPYGFSLIAFEPSLIEIKFERHRVSLVKTHRKIYMFTSKGQGQNLTSGQGHGVTQVAYQSKRIDETNTLRPLSCLALLNLKLSAKNCWWPRVTSDDLRGVTDQHLTLGHHEWPKSTWSWKNCALRMRWEGFQYFPHWLIMERSGAWPDPRS